MSEVSKRSSAQGSEQMAWKLFPGLPHICDFCRRDLRIQDVGEHRTFRDNSKEIKTVFWCVDHRGGRA